MKRWALLASLVVNLLLIVALAISREYRMSTSLQLLADATQAEVKLQEHILTEIESGDAARIAAVREMLRRNIRMGKQATANWRTAARR